MNARLYRSRDDRMLAGVAGGLAEHWDADPSLVRLIWALLVIFTGGIALVVYIVMAFVVPEAPEVQLEGEAGAAGGMTRREARRAARRERRSGGSRTAAVVFGAMLMFAGVWFLIEELFPALNTDILWPVALIVLGIALLAVAVRPRGTDPISPTTPGQTSEPGSVAGAGS